MNVMHTPIPVITVDGPSGSGKGTIGLRLAKEKGWHFLDSGALYRVLALLASRRGVALTNEKALQQLALNLDVQFEGKVMLEGQAVTQEIRTERCGDMASQIAVFSGVRAALLERQRAFCQFPGLIADGRDMGTVVFPGAVVKIFLEASVEERAKRRYLELMLKGQDVTLENLLQEISARDVRDKGRVISPLIPAIDSVVIDTTGMGIEQVFEQVLEAIKEKHY